MPEKALDLSKSTSSVKGIGPAKQDALAKAGIHTINDLINYKIPAIICPLPFHWPKHTKSKEIKLTEVNEKFVCLYEGKH